MHSAVIVIRNIRPPHKRQIRKYVSTGADPGICVRGAVPSPRLTFPLEGGCPLNQLGGLWESCKLPAAENEFGTL